MYLQDLYMSEADDKKSLRYEKHRCFLWWSVDVGYTTGGIATKPFYTAELVAQCHLNKNRACKDQ